MNAFTRCGDWNIILENIFQDKRIGNNANSII